MTDTREGDGSRMRIGGLELALDLDATEGSIAGLTRELWLRVEGTCPDPEAALSRGLTSKWDHGRIKLSVGLTGVYRAGGGLGGRFRFENGRCSELHLSFRVDGLDYGLSFSGDVTVTDRGASIQGHFDRAYPTEVAPFSVDVQVALDPGALDWTEYRFTTLEEVEAAPADQLRFVGIKAGALRTFPAALFEAAGLESLSLWTRDEVPLTIPDELSALTALVELHIANYDIGELPDLSRMLQLKQLSIFNAGLTQTPRGLLGLPALRFLNLAKNRLRSVPEGPVNLPALESIALEDNRLTTLPDALIAAPKLRRLSLDGNPWESLPDRCADLDLKLDIGEKRRLFDYEYRGADGSGMTSWDDEIFHARSHPELSKLLNKALKPREVRPHADAFRYLAKRSVCLQHAEAEDYGEVGGHRFGGFPDLPASIAYPRYGENPIEGRSDYAYEFLAQVNLSKLAPLQDYLPRRGMLYFFLTTLHDLYGGARTPAKVLYLDSDVSQGTLVSGRSTSLDRDDYFEMMEPCYAAYKATASAGISVPSLYALSQNPHLARGVAASLAKDARAANSCLHELVEEPMRARFPLDHEMGGYGFSQHEHPEAQAALALKGAPEDWMILLTVASRGSFSWGDAGDLFFVIHKSDLARRDFSNVFCTLESS